MKKLLKILFYVILAIALTFFWGCERESKDKIYIVDGPFAELADSTNILITWETNLAGNSVVDYGISIDLDSTVFDEEERQNHRILLSNLYGKTIYYYQVGSGSSLAETIVKSDIYEFTTGENEESIILIGWDFFTQNQLDSAEAYFNKALLLNAEHGWAYVGLGWIRLRQDDFPQALNQFNTGLSFDNTLLDGRVGRASIQLSLSEYEEVISDCIFIVDTDPAYIFEFDLTIDYHDVHLLLAQAYYATEQFELAQGQCDILDPTNGLDPAMPSTWVVSGTFSESYYLALLNLINYLDSLY